MQNICLRLLSLRSEVLIELTSANKANWTTWLKSRYQINYGTFWLTHFCEECRLRKWLVFSELSWKSVSIQLHTSWIVDGNYIYLNFSCTEACVSKMKTTALCVFALFLSSMLVEGVIPQPDRCHVFGNCNGEKVHE